MEQITTATTNVTGDLIWSIVLAPPSFAVMLPPSVSAASMLNKFPSSANNCFSAAMRRFPAGDEFMHSPMDEEEKD